MEVGAFVDVELLEFEEVTFELVNLYDFDMLTNLLLRYTYGLHILFFSFCLPPPGPILGGPYYLGDYSGQLPHLLKIKRNNKKIKKDLSIRWRVRTTRHLQRARVVRLVLVILPLVLNRLQHLSPVLLQLGVWGWLRAPLLVVEDARVGLVQVDAV